MDVMIKKFSNWSMSLIIFIFCGPVMLFSAFVLQCMIAITVFLWRSSKCFASKNCQVYQNSIKQSGIVLVYPVIYFIFCTLLLVNRLYSLTHTEVVHLWIIQAVADAGRTLIPAVAFFLCHCVCARKSVANSLYIKQKLALILQDIMYHLKMTT